MNEALARMMRRYDCQTGRDYQNALREIIQEIALLGLWRSKFFEKAAFYGGSALRILYGQERFSEDLDFSLLQPDINFRLDTYGKAILTELESMGFNVSIEKKKKHINSAIKSAFIKANTLEHLIKIGFALKEQKRFHAQAMTKIKIEIDTDPPGRFHTEAKFLLQPFPFSVNTFSAPDLFAGKMHAVLCRIWGNRVKGRDWYDLLWFVSQKIPLNLKHLEARMRQTGHYNEIQGLTRERFLEYFLTKVETLDIDNAKKDILPFLHDPVQIEVWSQKFFHAIAPRIEVS